MLMDKQGELLRDVVALTGRAEIVGGKRMVFKS